MAVQTLSQDETAERFPSIGLAYEFVRPSYDLMVRRFEAVEARVRALLTLVGTLTFGAPVLVKGLLNQVHFDSLWLWLGLALALIAVVLGIFSQVHGTIRQVDPRLMSEDKVAHPEWEFKWFTLLAAGEDFRINTARLNGKANVAVAMAVLLFLEVGCFALWTIRDN